MRLRNIVIRALFLVLVPALFLVLPAWSDYESGERAFEAGRAGEALEQWRMAADGGDARAMAALGRLYLQGVGVMQDFVEAHKWFNLAASRGDSEAAKQRDALAEKMTPQERAQAQKLARGWRPERRQSAETPAPAPPPAPEATPPPPRALREAQVLLRQLGYAPGIPDGIWGARSVRAYRAFLRDAGLASSEVLTLEALQAMRAIAKRQGTGREAPAQVPRPVERSDALHRAAAGGDIDGVASVLRSGADVDGRDSHGWTALMHAVNKGYTVVVQQLLEAGVGVDVRAADGSTALFMASVHGHSGIIELLMESGADPKVQGPQSKTAVEVARVKYGDLESARSKGEGSGVLALLQGMTLAEGAQREVEQRAEAQREAERAADDAAYARAQVSGTEAAYTEYLSSWPQGRHVEEARRLLAEIEEERRRKTLQPFGPNWMIVENQPCQVYTATPSSDATITVTWTGACVNGKAHGQGLQTFSDGQRYEGEFRHGMKHGRGIISWAHGEFKGYRYEGEFRRGRASNGVLTSPNGRYEGEFRDEKRHGRGNLTWTRGKFKGHRYDGEFLNDLYHGRGKYTFLDGSYYEGEFRHGKPHGGGTFTNANGKRFTYRRQWREGCFGNPNRPRRGFVCFE